MTGLETSSGAAARPALDSALMLDALARAAAVLWFGLLAWRSLLPRFFADWAAVSGSDLLSVLRLVNAVCLLGLYLLFIAMILLRARPIAKSPGFRPRLEAALGGFLVYALPLLPLSPLDIVGQAGSAVLMAGGAAFALFTLAWLGRSFSIMAEARGVVTSGPYAVVRHPLYLAEGIANFGACLQFAFLPALALFAVQSVFQVRRMLNEEAVLRQVFPDYGAYMQRTARLIPGIW